MAQAKIAILASGSGSNAAAILQACATKQVSYTAALVVTNKPTAGVLQVAHTYGVPTMVLRVNDFAAEDVFANDCPYLTKLNEMDIKYIVLAGYLKKIPKTLLQSYPNRILNIHPALLPRYGGQGMYGNHVHEAVIASRATLSGLTIHLVNDAYDEGKILFQATCPVTPTDTTTILAAKVLALEHRHYATIINYYITTHF